MKKIMFYINAIHLGGAERVVVNLAQKFTENNYDVVLVTSFYDSWEYPVDQKVKRLSLENDEIEQSFLVRNMSRIKKLRLICKAEKPDLLISFMAEPNFRALLAAKGTKIKNLISIRSDPDKEYQNFVYRIVAKILYRGTDGCVFQTEDAQSWFSKRIRDKSKVIMNQVDDKFYNTQRSIICKNIVSCGRLSKPKNYEMLIKAFAKIANNFPQDNLLLYGDGELFNELDALIKSLNLESRVRLMGTSQNIPEILSQAKLFVLSSDYEGMPNALLEAMAIGVPCISTDCPCGGPRMVIQDGVNGILVEVGNESALADAMSQLLNDPKLAADIGDQAKAGSKRYSSENVFKDWMSYVSGL